jgi:hypothetical protein
MGAKFGIHSEMKTSTVSMRPEISGQKADFPLTQGYSSTDVQYLQYIYTYILSKASAGQCVWGGGAPVVKAPPVEAGGQQ